MISMNSPSQKKLLLNHVDHVMLWGRKTKANKKTLNIKKMWDFHLLLKL